MSIIWNTSYSANCKQTAHNVLMLHVLCPLYKKCITNNIVTNTSCVMRRTLLNSSENAVHRTVNSCIS
jgi:hypothetical protein